MAHFIAIDHPGEIHLFALKLCPAVCIGFSHIFGANLGTGVFQSRD